MKADRIGTPSEQARAACGWLSPRERARAVRDGQAQPDHYCGTCANVGTTARGRLACNCPPGGALPSWATRHEAVCFGFVHHLGAAPTC